MSLADHLTTSLHASEAFGTVSRILAAGGDATLAAPGLIRPLLTASVFRERPRPVLVVLAGEEAAERYARQTAAFLQPGQVLRFPERTDMPWADTAPDLEAVGRRARALYSLGAGRPAIVVASARSLVRALPPQGSQVFDPLVLEEGASLDLEQAAARLARMGYERVETAQEHGTFAVRGGVLDVFPSDAMHPVRAELFGDEIETLRRYVPTTGQSIGEAGTTEVFGCREVMVGSRAASRATRALRDKALKHPEIAHHLEMIEQGVYFNGIEQYLPVLYEQQGLLTDYLSPDTLIVVAEPRSLFDDATRRYEEITATAKITGHATTGLFLPAARIDLGGRQRLMLLSLLRAGGAVDAELAARRPEVAGGEDKFLAGLRALLALDYSVVLAVPERRARRRMADLLVEAGITIAAIAEEPAEDPSSASRLEAGVVHISQTEVPAGFVIAEARLAVVSIDDIYPRSSRGRRAAREIDPTRLTFGFEPGDYVVHATHGIALFTEMQRREVLGAERDYLVLEYAKGDRLYVPVEQIDRITKFVGADGSAPRITRLNTAE